MDKLKIAELIEQKHQDLFFWLEKQPKDNWEKGPENKWSTSQHFLHLKDSIQLLNKALGYPEFILKYKFGTCNRPTRDYENVSKNYLQKLSENQERARNFNKDLAKPLLNDKVSLLSNIEKQQKKLQKKVLKSSDKNLDTLLIPHPLMGKMTLREIIMWTAFHTEHHTETLKNNY